MKRALFLAAIPAVFVSWAAAEEAPFDDEIKAVCAEAEERFAAQGGK